MVEKPHDLAAFNKTDGSRKLTRIISAEKAGKKDQAGANASTLSHVLYVQT
jgi:hypothetical protein